MGSLRWAKFELRWAYRWRMNGMDRNAFNCGSQSRKFQKLYNADPYLVEWKGLD